MTKYAIINQMRQIEKFLINQLYNKAMQGQVLEFEPISIDPKAYRFFPKRQEEKVAFNKLNSPRLVFYGQIEHDDIEKKKLEEFKIWLKDKKYYKEYFDDQRLLLFLHFSVYKPENAYAWMQRHQEFYDKYIRSREAPFQRLIKYQEDERLRQIISSGFFYICGRDKHFRPTMVFNLPKTDLKDTEAILRGIIYVQEEVIQKMFLPGQVQHWNIIFDLGGMGLTDIPLNSLKNLVQLISYNYSGRLYKLWMFNCPNNIFFSWKIVKNFLSQITVDKISLVKKNTDDSLWKQYDRGQIQKKYGGNQPDKTQFYPFVVPKAAIQSSRLISDEKYKQYLDSGFLKRNIIDPKYIKTEEKKVESQPDEKIEENREQKIETKIEEQKNDKKEEKEQIKNNIDEENNLNKVGQSQKNKQSQEVKEVENNKKDKQIIQKGTSKCEQNKGEQKENKEEKQQKTVVGEAVQTVTAVLNVAAKKVVEAVQSFSDVTATAAMEVVQVAKQSQSKNEEDNKQSGSVQQQQAKQIVKQQVKQQKEQEKKEIQQLKVDKKQQNVSETIPTDKQ